MVEHIVCAEPNILGGGTGDRINPQYFRVQLAVFA